MTGIPSCPCHCWYGESNSAMNFGLLGLDARITQRKLSYWNRRRLSRAALARPAFSLDELVEGTGDADDLVDHEVLPGEGDDEEVAGDPRPAGLGGDRGKGQASEGRILGGRGELDPLPFGGDGENGPGPALRHEERPAGA